MMNLNDAFKKCEEGNFVTHLNFDSKQSMHYHNGNFYYEDGANLTHQIEWLERQEFLKEGWSVKFTPEQIDKQKLAKMHVENDKYMLKNGSYEECIL